MYDNAYQVAASKQSAANAKKYEHNGIPMGSVVGPSPITGKYMRHLGNNQWQEVTWNKATRKFETVWAPPAQPQQQAAQQPPPPAPAPQAPAAQQPAQPQAPAPQPAAAQQGAAAPVPASTYAGWKPGSSAYIPTGQTYYKKGGDVPGGQLWQTQWHMDQMGRWPRQGRGW